MLQLHSVAHALFALHQFRGLVSRHLPPDIQSAARRKLRILDAAVRLSDLRSPPGNRLEALKGGRAGQHSLCINDQWRICFVWREATENDNAGGNVDAVEIVDYH